jgi:hypothetical protein
MKKSDVRKIFLIDNIYGAIYCWMRSLTYFVIPSKSLG